jgi:glycerate kinase
MRVLVAFDKFKNSIPAPAACDIAAGAIASVRAGWDSDRCPLSDGGEGFMEILTRAAGGTMFPAEADGPRGGRVAAAFGIVSNDRIPSGARARLGAAAAAPGGSLGVVEMSAASGLALLEAGRRDPLRATTRGTGQLILAAAGTGAGAILLGVGGSATHDLGLGALGALGVSYAGEAGEAIGSIVPADWPGLRRITGRVSDRIPPILIACDVENPLLGPRGALAVYGPQKGLRPEEAPGLEAQGARIAAMLCRHFGRPEDLASRPGAGAAGGIAFGLMAAAGAALLPGFDLVASWLRLDERLEAADVVVTGEGRFDESSLSGKGPGSLVRRALALGKPVHVFAGEVAVDVRTPGLFTHAVTPPGMALSEALSGAPALLAEAVRRAFAGR